MTDKPWRPLVPEDLIYAGGGFAVTLRVQKRDLRKLLRALGGIDFDLLRIEPATRDLSPAVPEPIAIVRKNAPAG